MSTQDHLFTIMPKDWIPGLHVSGHILAIGLYELPAEDRRRPWGPCGMGLRLTIREDLVHDEVITAQLERDDLLRAIGVAIDDADESMAHLREGDWISIRAVRHPDRFEVEYRPAGHTPPTLSVIRGGRHLRGV